jgi:hypothetical protein
MARILWAKAGQQKGIGGVPHASLALLDSAWWEADAGPTPKT